MARSARIQFSHMLTESANVILIAAQPAAFLLIALFPATTSTPEYTTRMTFAVLLTTFWNTTVWGAAGILRRERIEGTLSTIMTTVTDPRLIAVGKGLGASVAAICGILLTLTLTLAVLGRPIILHNGGWIVAGLLVTLGSGTAVGMLVGSIFLATRFGTQVSSAAMYPVFLLGGMMIPASILPPPLSWVSYGISLSWLQKFLAAAGNGEVGALQVGYLFIAIWLSAMYVVMGSALVRRTLRRARKEATLDLV